MAYSSATNTKILNFNSRAQTRISDNATANALYYYEGDEDLNKYQKNLEESDELASVMSAIDNQYNDWTEAEIVKVIEYFEVKYALATVPYVEREDFNMNITVTTTEINYAKSYAVSTLPSPSPAAGLIYVSDETGGATLAFSDGINWRRVQDRAIVS